MKEREKLEKELLTFPDEITRDMVLEFVIADRKRIVEPYIKALTNLLSKHNSKDFCVGKDCYMHVEFKSVDEALKTLDNALGKEKCDDKKNK